MQASTTALPRMRQYIFHFRLRGIITQNNKQNTVQKKFLRKLFPFKMKTVYQRTEKETQLLQSGLIKKGFFKSMFLIASHNKLTSIFGGVKHIFEAAAFLRD